jgi:hypothetical protein
MVAVSVGHVRKRFCLLRVQPELVGREKKSGPMNNVHGVTPCLIPRTTHPLINPCFTVHSAVQSHALRVSEPRTSGQLLLYGRRQLRSFSTFAAVFSLAIASLRPPRIATRIRRSLRHARHFSHCPSPALVFSVTCSIAAFTSGAFFIGHGASVEKNFHLDYVGRFREIAKQVARRCAVVSRAAGNGGIDSAAPNRLKQRAQ